MSKSVVRRSGKAILIAGVAVALVVGSGGFAQAAPAAAASPTKTSSVIVVLRNQHTDLALAKGNRTSPRRNAYRSDQASVIGSARADGARELRGFDTVNAVAATVNATQAHELAADPAVAAVYPDLPISAVPVGTDRPASAAGSGSAPTAASARICPSDPSKPLLEPEALQVTHTAYSDPATPQAQKIVDGTGVKVAFIADGLDITNPDFVRANGTHVFIDYQDFSGDGTAAATGGAEAFGDASAIAAQGRQTYDLASYVNVAHPLPAGCTIQIRGMAPGASLIGLKVFGAAATAPTSRFIEAIDYAVASGADVLNESFGGNPYPDTSTDPISLADASAVAAGVTVVASTGDAGVTGTVGSPASSSAVIGVAATTTFRSYLQETGAGAQLSNGTWTNNNISGLSSGGITYSARTPDLAAPGDLGWALCTADLDAYSECTDDNGNPSPIQNFGGTSQSSPLTAGAAALVIEAYEHTHGGTRPTPAVVKQILTGTATDLGHPAYEQGAGELDSFKAVQAAQSWHAPAAATGAALLVDKTQLSAIGYPAASVAQRLTVTNDGAKPQRVTASTRTLGRTVATSTGTAALNTATSAAFVDAYGISRSYVAVTFTVARDVDRLTFSATAASAPSASRVILFDPKGTYTAYSIPQGAANYAMSDVRYPVAGTWTALIAVPTSSAFNGSVGWKALEQRFTTDGTVYPSSFTLAPGASRTVTVLSREPRAPGDESASVQFSGSASGITSVPLTLRAVVPPRDYTFSGTITGGNGRDATGQAQLYYLDVPRGRHNLGVGIHLGDPGNVVFATLTAPSGQSYSLNSNVNADATATVPGIQDYVDNPVAGRWVLSIQVLNPVSGQFITSPYQVKVAYDSVSASARSLPTSTRTRLAAGTAVTIPVTVSSTSVKDLQYFVDPRLDTVGTLSLAELSGTSTFALPQPADVIPFWLVPSHVSSFAVNAAADQPVNADIFWQGGNPDVYAAATGNSTTATATGAPLTPGIWGTDLGQTGPFGAGGAPAGTVTVSATATGQLFDTDVSSDTGDFWVQGVADQSTSTTLDRASIERRLVAARTGGGGSSTGPQHPGSGAKPVQRATIMVTITPSGPKGSQVHGHLYIGAYDGYLGSGDELVDLPYAYTVG